MPVKLSDWLGKNRAAQVTLLNEPLSFSEAAGVTNGVAIYFDGVDHSVAVKEVVGREGLEKGVCTVTEVNAVNAIGDCAGDG